MFHVNPTMLHRRRREACLKSEPRVRKDYTIATRFTQPFFAEQAYHAISVITIAKTVSVRVYFTWESVDGGAGQNTSQGDALPARC